MCMHKPVVGVVYWFLGYRSGVHFYNVTEYLCKTMYWPSDENRYKR